MCYPEKFYNILRGYVCCPLTLDDVNPHWSVDVVRYRAGVVALVHRTRLSIFVVNLLFRERLNIFYWAKDLCYGEPTEDGWSHFLSLNTKLKYSFWKS